ncbi:Phox-like protein [Trichodelitschia bisporula]|uniref:Sorting nexin-4 n=1 Tax=Trichodelitschia bisporula TaxID=703511 RepID=A0A6G1I632_9PEZI|nr:Phox-like protein [Trichodelitschia bisporula]
MHPQDFGDGRLECTVDSPLKENEGTKDVYISYLVTTRTNFPTFQRPETKVRRRFRDFVFLYESLTTQYAAVAVPPLPEKHNMAYVRGDRFGADFTLRRSHSLHRFLKRITLHPELRRSSILLEFLESPEWHATMRGRVAKTTTVDQGNAGVFDNFTDTFLNAFTKVHKPDKRFIEVKERADKLDEDLGHVEKIVTRVARRQGDLETDYGDLATQFRKLITLEPGVEQPLTSFASSLETTSLNFKALRDHTGLDYASSLRDMTAYIAALRALLKAREQKQLDFEGLSDYLARAAADRDQLASQHGSTGAGGFLRSKIEDVRGVDHEQARRDRQRKLEIQIQRLTREVEQAKIQSESFDDRTVSEVEEFERIKSVELQDTLGSLADSHIDFFKGTVETWEEFLEKMEQPSVSDA